MKLHSNNACVIFWTDMDSHWRSDSFKLFENTGKFYHRENKDKFRFIFTVELPFKPEQNQHYFTARKVLNVIKVTHSGNL